MRRRHLARAAGLLLARPAAAGAAASDDPVLLSVQVDAPAGGPLVQEMVRITVRAIFRAQPNQVILTQPEFVDARWLSLGEDEWGHVSLGGPDRVLLQRRLAWFAQRSGTLQVGAFTLQAMVLTPDLARVAVTRRTAPFAVAVRPAPEDAAGWWLPAGAVRLAQSFSAAPDRLRAGQVTRRVVILEAKGIEAPQLPPLPALSVPGVIAFAQPMTTRTVLTPQGPTVRATYAWDLKPVNASPALLPEIRVPWFDAVSRTLRDAVLPAVRVGLAESADTLAAPHPPPPRPAAGIGVRDIAASAAGFLLASAALQLPLDTLRAVAARAALAWRVRRALRRGEFRQLRALLAGACGPGARQPLGDALAALDRHLFAAPPAPLPPLRALPRTILLGRPRPPRSERRP